MRFQNRSEAGRQLAARLEHLGSEKPIVVALPRGGVPVGFEVARQLGAPLEVLVVRKLGAPGHHELGVGAIAQGGGMFINDEVVTMLGVTREYIQRVARKEREEIDRRNELYRGGRPPVDVRGQTVILVDDGLATGGTMRAAIRALRPQKPRAIVLAVPTCARDTADDIRSEVDEMVCLMTPEDFYAVGVWYYDFAQTGDDEVVDLMARAARERTNAPTRTDDSGRVRHRP